MMSGSSSDSPLISSKDLVPVMSSWPYLIAAFNRITCQTMPRTVSGIGSTDDTMKTFRLPLSESLDSLSCWSLSWLHRTNTIGAEPARSTVYNAPPQGTNLSTARNSWTRSRNLAFGSNSSRARIERLWTAAERRKCSRSCSISPSQQPLLNRSLARRTYIQIVIQNVVQYGYHVAIILVLDLAHKVRLVEEFVYNGAFVH